jgi:hypothetical protein
VLGRERPGKNVFECQRKALEREMDAGGIYLRKSEIDI